MGEDAGDVRSFKDRFTILRSRMCQLSVSYDPCDPRYTEGMADILKELGLGCVIESSPPSRIPASSRCDSRYVAACWMEIIDMQSRLTLRFMGRVIGYDRKSIGRCALRELFRVAGMNGVPELNEFRVMDMAPSENISASVRATLDAPFVVI